MACGSVNQHVSELVAECLVSIEIWALVVILPGTSRADDDKTTVGSVSFQFESLSSEKEIGGCLDWVQLVFFLRTQTPWISRDMIFSEDDKDNEGSDNGEDDNSDAGDADMPTASTLCADGTVCSWSEFSTWYRHRHLVCDSK